YAPTRSPEVAVVVLVEHGGAGGKHAPPVAFEVIRAYQELGGARGAAQRAASGRAPGKGTNGPRGGPPCSGSTPPRRADATTSIGRCSSLRPRSPCSAWSTYTARRASTRARAPSSTSARSIGSWSAGSSGA